MIKKNLRSLKNKPGSRINFYAILSLFKTVSECSVLENTVAYKNYYTKYRQKEKNS